MVVIVCISDYIAVSKIRHSLVCHLQVLMFSVVTQLLMVFCVFKSFL